MLWPSKSEHNSYVNKSFFLALGKIANAYNEIGGIENHSEIKSSTVTDSNKNLSLSSNTRERAAAEIIVLSDGDSEKKSSDNSKSEKDTDSSSRLSKRSHPEEESSENDGRSKNLETVGGMSKSCSNERAENDANPKTPISQLMKSRWEENESSALGIRTKL